MKTTESAELARSYFRKSSVWATASRRDRVADGDDEDDDDRDGEGKMLMHLDVAARTSAK